MYQLKFYKVYCDNIYYSKLTHPYTQHIFDIDGNLNIPINILNPIIPIRFTNNATSFPLDINYVEIWDTTNNKRIGCYYIDNIKLMNKDIIEISCRKDILETFFGRGLGGTFHLSRSTLSKDYDRNVVDNMLTISPVKDVSFFKCFNEPKEIQLTKRESGGTYDIPHYFVTYITATTPRP